MSQYLRKICLAGLVLLATPVLAQEELNITITQGLEGALPIAVVPFAWTGADAGAPTDMAAIIAGDLSLSGRFTPLAVKDLPARPSATSEVRFEDWRLLGPEYLVVGDVSVLPDGRFGVQFRLFDVFKGAQLIGYAFEATAPELRRTAHQISDLVYEKLTGERGAFTTRVAYVTEFDDKDGAKRYALNVADMDGHNAYRILESAQPVMSPAWSPDGARLAYVSFEGRRPRVFVQALATGEREEVSAYPGLNSAPAWSPDGAKLALALSKDGNPEIYVLDLRTRLLSRMTDNVAIDTEPAWSPDGRTLVFTSDRGGQPQIYRMAVNGGRAERLTFEGTYNARASFSPDGRRLALVHGNRGAYRVGLMDVETRTLRVLTDTRLDESPSFAPNGSMILYATTDARGAALAAVSVDGRVRHRLAVQAGAVREPAWSPFSPSR